MVLSASLCGMVSLGAYITMTGDREGTNLLEWFAKDNWIPQANRGQFSKRRRPECVAKRFSLDTCSPTLAMHQDAGMMFGVTEVCR
jgi:hypothetical protein